jgi:phosphoribosylaminoimidazole-succinocarboxamide synthase
MSSKAITNIDIQGKLPRVASGKVRDLYAINDETLLFVASDRISAYDVIMENVSIMFQKKALVFFALTGRKKTNPHINHHALGYPRQRRPPNRYVNLLVPISAHMRSRS